MVPLGLTNATVWGPAVTAGVFAKTRALESTRKGIGAPSRVTRATAERPVPAIVRKESPSLSMICGTTAADERQDRLGHGHGHRYGLRYGHGHQYGLRYGHGHRRRRGHPVRRFAVVLGIGVGAGPGAGAGGTVTVGAGAGDAAQK